MLENLSKKYNKQFVWKFTATSHGKGVVDRVGANVKSNVRRCVMSKGKNPIIVQDCESFVNAARNLIRRTKILNIDEAAIIAYKNTNPFDNACDITGISKMHVMQVSDHETCLWRNFVFQVSAKPDIVLKIDVCQVTDPTDAPDSTEQNVSEYNPNNDLIAIDYENVAIGMLVITIYDNEKFLGNVIEKKSNQIRVRCLEKPLGLNDLQDLEREEDAAFFNCVFKTNIKSVLTQVDANDKKRRKWYWKY